MPVINKHYPYFMRTPNSIRVEGEWGYGSKGAKVVIPNTVRVYDDEDNDVTEYAFPSSPSTYPTDADSCTVTIAVFGAKDTTVFSLRGIFWTRVTTTVTVPLVNEALVLSESQDVQKEGEAPTLKFKVLTDASEGTYVEIPSGQVGYSIINGNRLQSSNSARWDMGVAEQEFTAYCSYSSSRGNVMLTCSGTADICGYGVQGRTIYITDDDSDTTEVNIPMKLLNVSQPTLMVSPSNRAFYATMGNGVLNLTVQNDSMASDEETYFLSLTSEELTGSYEFKVSKRALVGLTCSGTPLPQVSGTQVDMSGLSFKALYEDGSSRNLSLSDLSYMSIVPSDISQWALRVSYTDWGKYSHRTKNNASTTVYLPVYGIRYTGGSYTVEPNEEGEYPQLSTLFEPSLAETLEYSIDSLSVGDNVVTVTGEHNDSLTVTLTCLGGIGSMELLTTDITWTNDNDAKVNIRVATDGSEYFHSSVRDVTSNGTDCNIIGTMEGNGEVEFTLDADGTDLNTSSFEVKMPNGAKGNVTVHKKLNTEGMDFPTSISVGSNREWTPVSVSLGFVEGCEGCAGAVATVDSDKELSATYSNNTLTLGEGEGTVVGETYTFTLNGEEHEVKFLGKYSSASFPYSSKSVARGNSFEVTPVFTSEDEGVPVHKSDMPSSWYMVEMSNGENCLTVSNNRVTATSGKTATSTSLALMLNWGDGGRYGAIPSSIGGDVTVYEGLHTSLGILGDCELSFNVPQTLVASHVYLFHSGYKWNLLEDGDELNVAFKNGDDTVYSIKRVGRNRTGDSNVVVDEDENETNINTAWDIPVGIDNTDGRYMDSEGETYTKYEGTFTIPFSVSEDVTFDSIVISADVHEDSELEESDYEMLLSDPYITDLGEVSNLVTEGELEDDMPDATDYVELGDDGFKFKTTPNVGSWNPNTGELLDDIVAVSFKSNTISLQKDNYYYINSIPLQYENYKYLYSSLVGDDQHRESRGFIYKPTSTTDANLRITYDGHSGTIETSDINPWELRLDKYMPYVVNVGSASNDEDCWGLVDNRNFIGFESPVDTMTISIT